MDKPAFTFQVYDFNLTAGGSQTILAGGAYLRILTATGAVDVIVEGKGTMPNLLAGQGLKDLPFQRVVLRDKSGAPNSGTILVASSEFVDNRLFGTFDLSPSTLAALESVDLNTPTLNTLTRPLLPLSAWSDVTGALAPNTALTVFSAAANTNGAIIHDLQASDVITGSTGVGGFCARATAPNSIATFIDDTVVLQIESRLNLGGNTFVTAKLEKATRIAAGKGLFYLQNFTGAGAGSIMRNARYTLL